MVSLKNLCNYYLDCIGNESINISVYASSFKELDYIQLDNFSDEQLNLDNDDVSLFIAKRKECSFYIGYPTYANYCEYKNGNSFFKLEPIFLYKVNQENGSYSVDFNLPIVNFSAVKSICGSTKAQLTKDVIELEDTLGLYNNNFILNLEQLKDKLKKITPEWNWINNDDDFFHLSNVQKKGIYEKAILVFSSANQYTQGLVQELKLLAQLNNLNDIKDTALEQLFITKDIDTKIPEPEILEVLPINLEQKKAVISSLTSPVTVITGPPGTGKSQVIANILINAVLNGKKVLFASKNNKAVDVVEQRVNSIGKRPILLRQGGKYNHNLAKYLLSLFELNGNQNHLLLYKNKNIERQDILNKIEILNASAQEIMNLRNEIDDLDKEVDDFRQKNGIEFIKTIEKIDLDELNDFIKNYSSVLKSIDANYFNFFDKICWLFTKNKKIAIFENILLNLENYANKFNIKDFALTKLKYSKLYLDDYYEFSDRMKDQFEGIIKYKKYLKKLKKLKRKNSFENINNSIYKLNEKLEIISNEIWRLYLFKQSLELTRKDRNNLSNFLPLMKSLIKITDGGSLNSSQYADYRKLLEDCANLLPCWAVTSLSARGGKIPFEKHYYDIVVFDEASQCDIASALPLLYRAKSMVVIGDPKQLTHITSLKPSDEFKYRNKNNLTINDYKFSYIDNSLFGLAQSLVKNENVIMLKEHHRSHKDIINFSNKHFYYNELRIATKHNNLKLLNNQEFVKWVNIQGECKRPQEGGAYNDNEAKEVVNELKRIIIDEKYKGTVGVVTPFRAQANKIREYVNQNEELLNNKSADLLINTAHSFQGDERDIIIFSPVISENFPDSTIYFLNKDENIFNVAITRARANLIIVGDKKACLNSNVDYLSKFVEYIGELENEYKAGAYTQVSNPSFVSEWEEYFYKKLFENNIKLIPQYQTCGYSLDFALIEGDRKLNIELDGKYFHKAWDGNLVERDRIRNQRLYENNWDVMRFWTYEVINDIDGCINKVKAWIKKNN